MDEIKNTEILSFLNKMEADESYKQILRNFQGVPIICVAVVISMPSVSELRNMLINLWKEEEITINGSDYNNLIKSLLKNDKAFWFASVRIKGR